MNRSDTWDNNRDEGPNGTEFRRGDRVIIHLGGRDVPAVAASEVGPDGVMLVAHSAATSRVPAAAVRHAD